MASWEFHTLVGIVDKSGLFNYSEIEMALSMGLLPEFKLARSYLSRQVPNDFINYLRSNKELRDIEIAASVEPSPKKVDENLNDLNLYMSWSRMLNDLVDDDVINRINFHVGEIHSFAEEKEIKSQKKTPNESVSFSASEYLDGLYVLKNFYKSVSEMSMCYGIKILVEPFPNPDFNVADSMEDKEKVCRIKGYSCNDRWGATPWIPETFQHGGISTMSEINYLVEGSDIDLCFDVEHFRQTSNYSNENVMDQSPNSSKKEMYVLNKFGLFIREDEPLKFSKPLEIEEEMNTLEANVGSVHIGGQVSMYYQDNDNLRHIGSHMPLMRDNPYIMDEVLKRKMWEMGREHVKRCIQAVEKKGCNRMTFEIKSFTYGTEEWMNVNRETYRNVENILSEIS